MIRDVSVRGKGPKPLQKGEAQSLRKQEIWGKYVENMKKYGGKMKKI